MSAPESAAVELLTPRSARAVDAGGSLLRRQDANLDHRNQNASRGAFRPRSGQLGTGEVFATVRLRPARTTWTDVTRRCQRWSCRTPPRTAAPGQR